jgi:two-component system, chemotaxis family, CheB/CheR fusion protein
MKQKNRPEDLKSANEELQSINEELQSANEELTTSKEEMQSMNEELQTVNAELQSKVQDLTNEHNDLANLLNGTEIAVIFLDSKMRVRRFATHATNLFSLIPSDIGRPLSDLTSHLIYHQLQNDSQEVLRTLMFCEKQMTTNDRKWYRVRIMPYRTNDTVIEGVVITFTDITDIKNLELKLKNSKK